MQRVTPTESTRRKDCASLAMTNPVIPLARGGTHDIDNLVPACASCNSSKGAKLPAIEWKGRKVA